MSLVKNCFVTGFCGASSIADGKKQVPFYKTWYKTCT